MADRGEIAREEHLNNYLYLLVYILFHTERLKQPESFGKKRRKPPWIPRLLTRPWGFYDLDTKHIRADRNLAMGARALDRLTQ